MCSYEWECFIWLHFYRYFPGDFVLSFFWAPNPISKKTEIKRVTERGQGEGEDWEYWIPWFGQDGFAFQSLGELINPSLTKSSFVHFGLNWENQSHGVLKLVLVPNITTSEEGRWGEKLHLHVCCLQNEPKVLSLCWKTTTLSFPLASPSLWHPPALHTLVLGFSYTYPNTTHASVPLHSLWSSAWDALPVTYLENYSSFLWSYFKCLLLCQHLPRPLPYSLCGLFLVTTVFCTNLHHSPYCTKWQLFLCRCLLLGCRSFEGSDGVLFLFLCWA